MSEPIRGIVVAVGDWYARTLSICLAANMRHLAECLVVTAPGDPCKAVAESVPNVRVFETDAFWQHGAAFNKSLSLELGFDVLGRHGWILIHDADILLPDRLDLPDPLRRDTLYGMTRRILPDPGDYSPSLDWRTLHLSRDGAPIGFAQLFHADSPHLAGRRPWYDVTFSHAGGGDASFLLHFPSRCRRVLPIETLHLGPKDTHWFGTSPEARDTMAAYVWRHGWRAACRGLDPTAADRVGEIAERVEVPGYERGPFDLPFVRRSRRRELREARRSGRTPGL